MAEITTFIQAIELAKAGDNRGFEFLYNKTYKDKKFIALKYMKNEEDAEDVLQEAYVKVMNKIDTLDDPEKFPGWFGFIVANTAKDALRKKNPMLFSQLEQQNDEGEAMEFELEDEAIAAQPELSYTQKETQDLVREMMASLSDEQRVCIMMYYIEGMSVKEIADTLECSENTIKSRLNYGRKNIKAQGEELQKKGYQLYGMAPLPLFIHLLLSEARMEGVSIGGSPLAASASVAQGIQMGSAAGVATGAQVAPAAGVVPGMAAGAVTGMAAGTGIAQASGANVAMGAGVKKGILSTLGGKIAVCVASLAVVGGIGFGVMTLVNKDKDDKEAEETTTELNASEETTTELNASEEDVATNVTTTEMTIEATEEIPEEVIPHIVITNPEITYDSGANTCFTSIVDEQTRLPMDLAIRTNDFLDSSSGNEGFAGREADRIINMFNYEYIDSFEYENNLGTTSYVYTYHVTGAGDEDKYGGEDRDDYDFIVYCHVPDSDLFVELSSDFWNGGSKTPYEREFLERMASIDCIELVQKGNAGEIALTTQGPCIENYEVVIKDGYDIRYGYGHVQTAGIINDSININYIITDLGAYKPTEEDYQYDLESYSEFGYELPDYFESYETYFNYYYGEELGEVTNDAGVVFTKKLKSGEQNLLIYTTEVTPGIYFEIQLYGWDVPVEDLEVYEKFINSEYWSLN